MTEVEAVNELQTNIDLPFGFSVSDETSEMAIKALKKQNKIKEIIANANQWSKEDIVVKAQAFCDIAALFEEGGEADG